MEPVVKATTGVLYQCLLFLYIGRVGSQVRVSEQCIIGAGCKLDSVESLPPHTVIYGSKCVRYTKKIPAHASNQQQLEYLIKVLPNYHHLTKSTVN